MILAGLQHEDIALKVALDRGQGCDDVIRRTRLWRGGVCLGGRRGWLSGRVRQITARSDDRRLPDASFSLIAGPIVGHCGHPGRIVPTVHTSKLTADSITMGPKSPLSAGLHPKGVWGDRNAGCFDRGIITSAGFGYAEVSCRPNAVVARKLTWLWQW